MLQKYELSDKMIRLIGDNYSNLQVTIRFGLPLGVGDKSVQEVCEAHHVDARTFLTVVNFIAEGFTQMKDVNNEISVASLLHYLRQSHIYFLELCLPDIRRKLLDIIHIYSKDISFLILRLFDEYAKDVHLHMQYEENTVFKYVNDLVGGGVPTNYKISTFSKHHDAVGEKMTEFKNILIKYCSEHTDSNILNEVLLHIYMCEEGLDLHCKIEDYLFVPAILNLEKRIRGNEKQ